MDPHVREIAALNFQADKIRKEGDKKTALQLFSRALSLIRRHGAPPVLEAAVCSNFGILCLSQGLKDEAVKMQRRALALDETTGDRESLGFSHHNLGMALVESEELDEGIAHLETARELREAEDDLLELLATYEMLATAYLKAERIDEAEAVAKRGYSLKSKLGPHPRLRGIVSALAEIAAKRKDFDRACDRMEEAVELLEARRQANRTLAALDLYDSRYNKHYLRAIELNLEAGRWQKALTLIDRTRFRSGCDALEGVVRTPSSSDRLLPELRNDELVLVEWIYPTYDWSFALHPDRDNVAARKITTSSHKGDPIKVDLDTEWRNHFDATLRQTQRVIDAYEEDLKRVRRLVLVAHGVQWQTPFAALRHPATGELLAATHQLLLSPSLRYCSATDGRGHRRTGRCLVVGDPKGDLPAAREEAASVAATLGCKPILGRDATRRRLVRELAGGAFDTVHYAGHGVYTDRGLHALVLADGHFSAEDLLKLEFSADLFNLASCWSGMTTFSVWTELYGFIRALLIRGVRNVIGSAYPIGDDAAKTFSQALYADLERDGTIEAFRKATVRAAQGRTAYESGGLYLTGQRPAS